MYNMTKVWKPLQGLEHSKCSISERRWTPLQVWRHSVHIGLEAAMQRACQGQWRDWLGYSDTGGLIWHIFLLLLENRISHTSRDPYQTFRADTRFKHSFPFWSGLGKGGLERQFLVSLVQHRKEESDISPRVTQAPTSKVRVPDKWPVSTLPKGGHGMRMCASMVSLYEPVTMSGPSADAIQKGGTWIWDADGYNTMIKGMDPIATLPVFTY